MRTIHTLLSVQTLVIILGSINRLTNLTTAYVLPNQFLRWVDLLNMLVIPLASLLASYLLKRHLETAHNGGRRDGVAHVWLGIAFFVGMYLTAASYGDHEVTNYLHGRFCATDTTSDLCRIIIYNDDEFSHYVFFAGFTLVNTTLMFLQVIFPYRGQWRKSDGALIVINSLFIALGIFANLGFEEIGLDLVVVAALAVIALGLLWRNRRQPIVLYYAVAYGVGLVATVVVTGLRIAN
jgi:hypothetical protein